MTAAEAKVIKDLTDTIKSMNESNREFRNDVNIQVASLQKKIDEKHVPIFFEADIMRAAIEAMHNVIKTALEGYNSPLTKLTNEVVISHSTELKTLINDAFSNVINTEQFKESVIAGFSHKVARTIISNSDGMVDKVANELKQDAAFKARLTIAYSNVINEFVNKK